MELDWSMKRSDFFALTTLAGLGILNGVETGLVGSGKLGEWAGRYGMQTGRGAEGVFLKGRISRRDLDEGLQSLAGLSEGPLRAEGNFLRGSFKGEAFEVCLVS